MSVRNENVLNVVMGHFLTALYLSFPAACAAAAAYDIWMNGISSILAQVGLGIAVIFVLIRVLKFVFAAIDVAMEATRTVNGFVRASLAPWALRITEGLRGQGGRQLSPA